MVSVVIPTHNRENLIGRAIGSVLNQTYQNFEIIVVSDASTDNTKAVVEAMIKRDKRIKFIEYQPAKGGNVARNTGIDAAKGEYVAFLDDDDEWMPRKLELQMKEFKEKPRVGLVYTGVHIVYISENVEYNSKARDSGNLRKRILLDNCIGTTSTVVCKKEIFKEAGVFDTDLKALQDYDLWIRCCQICDVGIVPSEEIKYYNYTDNKGKSKQISSSTEKYKEAFSYINKKYETLFSRLDETEKKEKQCNEIVLLINKSLRNGNKKEARMFIREYIRSGKRIKGFLYFLLSFCSYYSVLKIRRKL